MFFSGFHILTMSTICTFLFLCRFIATKNWKTKSSSKNGLLLVIDRESSLQVDTLSESENFGKFFIHTLSHFNGTRSGSYVLDSLKRMTGTKQFLGLTNEMKECQVEDFEKCEQRIFLEKATQECNCIPWLMTSSFKVITVFDQLFNVTVM